MTNIWRCQQSETLSIPVHFILTCFCLVAVFLETESTKKHWFISQDTNATAVHWLILQAMWRKCFISELKVLRRKLLRCVLKPCCCIALMALDNAQLRVSTFDIANDGFCPQRLIFLLGNVSAPVSAYAHTAAAPSRAINAKWGWSSARFTTYIPVWAW